MPSGRSGGYGGRSAYRSAGRSASRSTAGRSDTRYAAQAAALSATLDDPLRNPPRPARPAPPPAPVQGGGSVLGGIGATIADGLAFGTGSAIAHRAADAVLGPRTVQHEMVGSPSAPPGAAAAPVGASTSMGSDACSTHSKAFLDCIDNFGDDISKCQFYFDMLKECRRAPASVLGV